MRPFLRHITRRSTWTWALTIAALLSAIVLAAHLGDDGSSTQGELADPSRRGDLVDHATSADGRYEVRALRWQSVLGEEGWDIVIQRTDGHRTMDAYAGCLFSEESYYKGIESVEAGSVRIATEQGPISITFDPKTMHVTTRIPVVLCQSYG